MPSPWMVAIALVFAPAVPSSVHAQSVPSPAPQSGTRRVSVTWEGVPLRDVLLAFASFSGVSIVAGSGVDGIVTADINDQPWDVALEAILASHGLFAVEGESGIIRVQSMAGFADQETVEPIVTRSYRLSFVRASEIRSAVEPLLSSRGSISILESTNTVIVSDIVRVQRTIADLLQ